MLCVFGDVLSTGLTKCASRRSTEEKSFASRSQTALVAPKGVRSNEAAWIIFLSNAVVTSRTPYLVYMTAGEPTGYGPLQQPTSANAARVVGLRDLTGGLKDNFNTAVDGLIHQFPPTLNWLVIMKVFMKIWARTFRFIVWTQISIFNAVQIQILSTSLLFSQPRSTAGPWSSPAFHDLACRHEH